MTHHFTISRIEGSRVWAREVNDYDKPRPWEQRYDCEGGWSKYRCDYKEWESSLREFEVAQECCEIKGSDQVWFDGRKVTFMFFYSSDNRYAHLLDGEGVSLVNREEISKFTPGQPITGSIEQREGKEYVIINK